MTHTPGPWRAVAGLDRWNVTTADKPRTFNICSLSTDRTEQKANAKLIAAAPNMLAALRLAESTLKRLQPFDGAQGTLDAVRIAIKEATGT